MSKPDRMKDILLVRSCWHCKNLVWIGCLQKQPLSKNPLGLIFPNSCILWNEKKKS